MNPIARLFSQYFASFNNEEHGWSRKKVVAWFFGIITAIIEIHWTVHCSFAELEAVLTINFTFIAACLGLSTWQAVQKNKVDAGKPPEEKTS